MNRTILGILAIVAALFLSLMAILRPVPRTPTALPHNEAAIPFSQQPTNAIPPPARPVRTGTILDPATEPTMATLPFTRVTLHLNDTPFMQAGATFAQATGIPFATSWFERADPATLPRITLHLDNAPTMEAFLQLWDQSHFTLIRFVPAGLVLRPTPAPPAVGNWCVCGPVAILANQIASTTDLAKSPPVTSPVTLSMQVYADPLLNVLLFPTALTFDSFVDNNDHPIKTPAASPNPIERGSVSPAQPISIPLTLNPAPATHIKRLKGHAPLLISGEPRTVVAQPTETLTRDVNGLGVEILPMTQQETTYTFEVHYRRNSIPAEQWALWTTALKSLRIRINIANRTPLPLPSLGRSQPSTPDQFVVTYTLNRNAQIGVPLSYELDIPTDLRLIRVPFEFHNLQLP